MDPAGSVRVAAVSSGARDPRGQVVVDHLLELGGRRPLEEIDDAYRAAIISDLPFGKLSNTSVGALSPSHLDGMLLLVKSDLTPAAVRDALDRISPP